MKRHTPSNLYFGSSDIQKNRYYLYSITTTKETQYACEACLSYIFVVTEISLERSSGTLNMYGILGKCYICNKKITGFLTGDLPSFCEVKQITI